MQPFAASDPGHRGQDDVFSGPVPAAAGQHHALHAGAQSAPLSAAAASALDALHLAAAKIARCVASTTAVKRPTFSD